MPFTLATNEIKKRFINQQQTNSNHHLMKPLTFFVFALLIFSSCRKDFASFQKSPNLSYSHKSSSTNEALMRTPIEPILMASVENLPVISDKVETYSFRTIKIEGKNTSLNNGRKRRNRKNVEKREGTFIQKIFPSQTHNNKKTIQKRRKPVPLNSTIYTGFVILGIAILLSLISLSSLSLLFGVAAIIFLYFGFKKYFRKIQRRNIFR